MNNPVIQTDIADILGQINQKLERLSEDVNDLVEVRSQESGIRSQESGVRSQESGVRSKKMGDLGGLKVIFSTFSDNLLNNAIAPLQFRILILALRYLI